MIRTWTPESETPTPPGGVDYRTVKAWFQQCRDLAAAIEAQKQKIQRIRDVAEKCTQSLSGMPAGGGNGDKVGFAVEQLDTERRQLQRMETDLCNLRVEATRRAYCLMAEPECAEAICEHYIMGRSHKEIAKEVGVCGAEVVYRRIKRGCMALAEIWDEFSDVQSVQHAQENTA